LVFKQRPHQYRNQKRGRGEKKKRGEVLERRRKKDEEGEGGKEQTPFFVR